MSLKIGRYKNWTDAVWAKSFKNRIAMSKRKHALVICPDVLHQMDAKLILEAYHQGPWRAIWWLIVHELESVWMHYGWPKWEWTRVHVLRLRPDQDLADFERYVEEQDALEEVCKQL